MGDCLTSPKFVEIFDTYFPYYLSYGMTYEQYWNDRPELVKSYRKAHEIKLSRKNEELWLQGAYIREAIYSSVGNMMSKKTIEYPKEPYPITKHQLEMKREEERRRKFERMKTIMEMASRTMKRGEVNDNNDR